jgi:LytR cell envelope-related transcriptional attenuator
MTAGPTPGQQRGTTRRARALARRRARTDGGSGARHAPPAEEWTVPSLPAGPRSAGTAPAPDGAAVRSGAGRAVASPLPAPRLADTSAPSDTSAVDAGVAHRHPARRLQRARRLVVAAIALLVMAGAGLVAVGLAQVRGSTAGQYIDPTLQPDDPGYAAFVTPTPTMLVLLRGSDGDLTGAALLALQAGDDGGAVIVMPAATQVPYGEVPFTLARAYADGDAVGVTGLVEGALEVAVHDTIEVDDQRWATLVEPVGSVSLRLDSPVGEWSAGTVSLEPDEVGRFLSVREPEESGLSRAGRQEIFWRAWLEEVARGGDEAIAGELDSGLGRFVRGLSRGADVDSLAVTVTLGQSGEEFAIDTGLAGEQIARSVPYPQSPAPGVRPRVRLLNGTSDRDLTATVAELLVAEGAEITISGNASSFDEPTTRISYADSTLRATATGYRELLGTGVVEQESSGQDAAAVDEAERIDVTVILGADAPEAIRR